MSIREVDLTKAFTWASTHLFLHTQQDYKLKHIIFRSDPVVAGFLKLLDISASIPVNVTVEITLRNFLNCKTALKKKFK